MIILLGRACRYHNGAICHGNQHADGFEFKSRHIRLYLSSYMVLTMSRGFPEANRVEQATRPGQSTYSKLEAGRCSAAAILNTWSFGMILGCYNWQIFPVIHVEGRYVVHEQFKFLSIPGSAVVYEQAIERIDVC